MPPEPSGQTQRRLRLTTPLGDGVLLPSSFSGKEELSRLFRYRVTCVSRDGEISGGDLLGQTVTICMAFDDDEERYFQGIVRRFHAGKVDDRGWRHYELELVPWLWLLTRNATCRVFQQRSVPQIITQILSERGCPDYALALHGDYAPREYCVQYRESDFAFISRLMEEEGIFYAFRHSESSHRLILADGNGAAQHWPESIVPYAVGSAAVASVGNWEHRYEYTSGKWSQTDYNFENPAKDHATPSQILLTEVNSVVRLHDNEQYEVFDFPGEYEQKDVGEGRTRVRMEEEEAAHDVAVGTGDCPAFSPLAKFTLENHPCESENGVYLIVSVQHCGSDPVHYSSGEDWSANYSNSFSCLLDSVRYRPERITPKPVIEGSQTAIVTGPAGEEIWPDEYGRVKVQFFWDRSGQRDETTSCWVRCAQQMAGKRWGSIFIPRVGQEVVVTFLEGDPDRPLITGVVYNSDQLPPYPLPAEKTKSCVKTNSSVGGEGHNEIRFEDLQGQEQLFLHAQRNLDVRVRADAHELVLGNRHLIVGVENSANQIEKVQGNKHLKVVGDHEECIDGTSARTVGCQESVVKGYKSELIHGEQHLHGLGNRLEKVDANSGVIVAESHFEQANAREIKAEEFIHLNVGAGGIVNIKPGQILLKVGTAGNFIQIDNTGIKIQGTAVQINCGMPAGNYSRINPPPDPADAREAAPVEPAEADNSVSGHKSAPDSLT